MKKGCLIGCGGIFGLFIILIIIGIIVGGIKNVNDSTSKEPKELMIDVNQFSKISSAELVEKLGDPEKIEDYEWRVPRTNESIVGKMYIYEQNKYEFILFDDSVARLNIYSGTFMGYDDTVMTFEKEQDIFDMFGIEPNNHLKKIADTNYALRFSPVSDTVADLWIESINGNEFEIAKITYNLNYY